MNLSDWRRRIDEIDKKLVQLLNERSHWTDAAIRRLFERIIDEARAAERDAMHSGDGAKREEK